MFSALTAILLMASLILGGGGITVAAAQNSLPDEALYPVKTWSEDVRAGLTNNERSRMDLALEFASRRAEEMQVMLRAGQVPPETLQTRMESEIDEALRLAAGKPDTQVTPALEQIREQLQEQNRLLQQVGEPTNQQATALIERTRTMLQNRLQLCDEGIQDPAALRQRLQERDQDRSGGLPTPALKPSDTGQGNPPADRTPVPGSGDGKSNPWTTGTPTPGSGYGPGPEDGSGSPSESGGNGAGNGSDDTGGSDTGSDSGAGSDSGNGAGNGSDDTGGSDTGSDSGAGSDSGSGAGNGSDDTGGSDTGSDSGSGSDNGGGSGSGGSDSGSGSGGGDGSGGGGGNP